MQNLLYRLYLSINYYYRVPVTTFEQVSFWCHTTYAHAHSLICTTHTSHYCTTSSLTTYESAAVLMVTMLAASVSLLPLSPEGTGSTLKKPPLMIRFAKRMLQFSENFQSQTSPNRNRWEEASELCHSLASLSAHTLPKTFTNL